MGVAPSGKATLSQPYTALRLKFLSHSVSGPPRPALLIYRPRAMPHRIGAETAPATVVLGRLTYATVHRAVLSKSWPAL